MLTLLRFGRPYLRPEPWPTELVTVTETLSKWDLKNYKYWLKAMFLTMQLLKQGFATCRKAAFNELIHLAIFLFDSVESWKNSGEKCLYVACIFVIISFLSALDVLGSFLVSRLQEVRRIFKCQ